jgi:hypothetical protein
VEFFRGKLFLADADMEIFRGVVNFVEIFRG